jgi:hypothetical protein
LLEENMEPLTSIPKSLRKPPHCRVLRQRLARYFDNIAVDKVKSAEQGWSVTGDKPMLWGGHFDLLQALNSVVGNYGAHIFGNTFKQENSPKYIPEPTYIIKTATCL